MIRGGGGVKRVNVLYDGLQYSIGQADVEALKAEIEAAHVEGRPRWVTLNLGEGRPQPAEVLMGPGIPVAIVPIPPDD